MARPLIDFIRVDEVAWREAALPGGSAPVRVRELSRDEAIGELSLVVQLPPGWSRPSGFVDQDEEIFVLSGELEDDGEHLSPYSYVFRSAGRLRRGAHSDTGCTFLAFIRSRAGFVAGERAAPSHAAPRDVAHLNLLRMEWERPKTPNFPAGAARKSLRSDAIDGSGLWVIGLLPHWKSGFTEWHSVEEENYILEGEIQTTEGCMTGGSYLAHPAEAVHGPMHSLRGALAITRAAGPFQTTYEPEPGYELPFL